MLTLNDERNELWQWDTGRTLSVDADCSQVHFSNKIFGRSIDVDVVGGVATIPDILLQTDKDLNVWAFVGTPENGYTKISKVFKVNSRNKPADYVFTPPEQTTLAEIMERLDDIESAQDPDAIKNAVDDYLANNPIMIEETDPTVPDWAKENKKPKYTADEVGALSKTELSGAVNDALAQAKESGEFDGAPGAPGKDGKDNLPNIVSVSGAAVTLTMDNNVEYHCADAVTYLTIEGFTPAADGKSSLWAVQFTAGESITVSLPDTVRWSVAEPVFTAGVSYWLSFVPLVSGNVLGVWVSNE